MSSYNSVVVNACDCTVGTAPLNFLIACVIGAYGSFKRYLAVYCYICLCLIQFNSRYSYSYRYSVFFCNIAAAAYFLNSTCSLNANIFFCIKIFDNGSVFHNYYGIIGRTSYSYSINGAVVYRKFAFLRKLYISRIRLKLKICVPVVKNNAVKLICGFYNSIVSYSYLSVNVSTVFKFKVYGFGSNCLIRYNIASYITAVEYYGIVSAAVNINIAFNRYVLKGNGTVFNVFVYSKVAVYYRSVKRNIVRFYCNVVIFSVSYGFAVLCYSIVVISGTASAVLYFSGRSSLDIIGFISSVFLVEVIGFYCRLNSAYVYGHRIYVSASRYFYLVIDIHILNFRLAEAYICIIGVLCCGKVLYNRI